MPSDIDRIVSLLPSGTEILCALGLRDRIVGVSHECDFPADVTSLPRLTSSILDDGLSPAEIDAAVAAAGLEQTPLYAVDGALLESLAPDLIVTQGLCAVCAVTEDTIARSIRLATLDAHSRAPVLSLSGVNLAGIRRDTLGVGRAAGVEAEAHALRVHALLHAVDVALHACEVDHGSGRVQGQKCVLHGVSLSIVNPGIGLWP